MRGESQSADCYPKNDATLCTSTYPPLTRGSHPGLGYDLGLPTFEEVPSLARAKNTSRAEARRRYRTLPSEQSEVDGSAEAAIETEALPEPARRRFFRVPDVLGDLRALPQMFLTRRLLWIPFLLVIGTFVAGMAANRGLLPAGAPTEGAAVAVQLFLYPQALLTYFLAGFFATRGPYLVGILLGALSGPLYSIWAVEALQGAQAGVTLGAVVVPLTVQGIFFGGLAAAFASWYRNFLRSSQERARANRIARDQQAVQKRKEQEREARRAMTRKPTSP